MHRHSPDQLPSQPELPDPLTFLDGRRVATPADWPARRDELLELFLTYEYGQVPDAVPVRLDGGGRAPAPGTAVQDLRLVLDERLPLQVQLALPAPDHRPAPVIVRIGLGCPDWEATVARGYACCTLKHQDLEPDKEGDQRPGPAQRAFPERDWGCIATWAWGASRVLDWLLATDGLDAQRAVVTGHSRTGKAALLAGALDPRFAVVVPNGSGCGGAAAYRHSGGDCETLELITRPARFMAWLHADFRRFAGNEDRLPFDQHGLRALVAPRALLTTDAEGDAWCNLPGTRAAWHAAQPVFDLLGAPRCNAAHFRAGDHDQLPEDWSALLDFADWALRDAAYPAGVQPG